MERNKHPDQKQRLSLVDLNIVGTENFLNSIPNSKSYINRSKEIIYHTQFTNPNYIKGKAFKNKRADR